MGGFLFGYDTAVISGTLSFVRAKFELNAVLEGWFVGSALVGCVIGVAFTGESSDLSGENIAFVSGLLSQFRPLDVLYPVLIQI